MRDGVCSKCGSATVHMARNGLHLGDKQYPVLLPHTEPKFRGALVGKNIEGLWQFVCVTCGYLEFHVFDRDALAFIQQRWPLLPRVDPPPG